jgi:hypothetical protein
MTDSVTDSGESRVAVIFVFTALAGSILMALLSNFLR